MIGTSQGDANTNDELLLRWWWCYHNWGDVGDIPNRYTSDVVLNQQARVAHQGGMADCLLDGPVAGKTMAVLDMGAHGRSVDRPMAGCLEVHA
jgi:hypothetical protein